MSGLLPATCALQIAFYIPHTYCYQSFSPPKLKRNKSKAPWAFHWLKGKQILPHSPPWFQSVQHKKKPWTLPFYFLSCKCFNSAILPALCTNSSPLIRSYLSSFNRSYITFRTVEIGKPYLFKEKKL